MTNNDIFKKLRVALMLRDDEIIDILKLVDFQIGKSELNAFFRKEGHPNYMECGDQVLRNFLNGLVLHLRGTRENPKYPGDVLSKKSKTSGAAGADRTGAGNSKSGDTKNERTKPVRQKRSKPGTTKSKKPKHANPASNKTKRPSFKEQQRRRMDTDITNVKYKNKKS